MSIEPELIPVVYNCGHTINILSPGVTDPAELFKKLHKETGEPVRFAEKCWHCDPQAAYLRQVPAETTEALRKAKAGEQ